MKKHIPNIITLLNLFCGALGIIYALEGKYNWVFLLVGVSLLADFADGLVARALNVKSELGAQLDSLADGVTFGVLPGIILYILMQEAFGADYVEGIGHMADYNARILKIEHFGLLFPLFAIYRLGKFNIDTRQTENFLGLATPAACMFVLGLLLIYQKQGPFFLDLVNNGYFLMSVTIMLSVLMVSELPMFSFKLKGLQWKGNESRFIFLLLCIPTIIFLKWSALPVIILLYILASILDGVIGEKAISK